MTTKLLALVVVLGGCGLSNSRVELFASIDDRGEDVAVGVVAQEGTDVQNIVSLDGASAALHFRGQTVPLSLERSSLSAHVVADPPVATDEPFAIDITRDGLTTTLEVTAPPAIDLTAPFPVFVPRSQDLVLSWLTVSDDRMFWYIEGGECVASPGGDIDPGATQVMISSSEFGMNSSFEPTCGTVFHLQRTREAAAARDGFEATDFVYARDLDVPFASTP